MNKTIRELLQELEAFETRECVSHLQNEARSVYGFELSEENALAIMAIAEIVVMNQVLHGEGSQQHLGVIEAPKEQPKLYGRFTAGADWIDGRWVGFDRMEWKEAKPPEPAFPKYNAGCLFMHRDALSALAKAFPDVWKPVPDLTPEIPGIQRNLPIFCHFPEKKERKFCLFLSLFWLKTGVEWLVDITSSA